MKEGTPRHRRTKAEIQAARAEQDPALPPRPRGKNRKRPRNRYVEGNSLLNTDPRFKRKN